MAAPWLSILIPVYNVNDFLDDCFTSILKQIDHNVEIIALDDQSTDDSFAHLQAIAAKAKFPIKILQHPVNRGISAVRNSLVAAATGDYVWLVDSDDMLADNAVAQLKHIVEKCQPDLVICDYHIWRPGVVLGKRKQKLESHVRSFDGAVNCLRYSAEKLFRGFYVKGKLHCWSKISKRSLWSGDVKFPEGRYFEDMVTMPRLALKVESYYYCPAVWVHYRQREGSILASFNQKKIDDMMAGVDGILSLWSDRVPQMSMSTRYYFVRYCIKNYMTALKETRRSTGPLVLDRAAYRVKLYQNIAMNKNELIKLYLFNGDVFRLIKALKALC